MRSKFSLTATRWDRFKYLTGAKSFKLATAGVIAATLAGGATYHFPTLESTFYEVTGLTTPEQVQMREELAVSKAALSALLEIANELEKPDRYNDSGVVKAAWERLVTHRDNASELINDSEASPSDLNLAAAALKSASDGLESAIQWDAELLAEQERKAAEEAEKKRKAEEEAKKKKEEEEAKKKAAEEAERKRAEEQSQVNPGAGSTSTPYVPPRQEPAPQAPSQPTAPPVQPPAQERYSTQMSITCRNSTVTFTATGGGTVNITAGGVSNSGSGSASVTVPVNGTVTASASAVGTVGITMSNTCNV